MEGCVISTADRRRLYALEGTHGEASIQEGQSDDEQENGKHHRPDVSAVCYTPDIREERKKERGRLPAASEMQYTGKMGLFQHPA
ncbi:hypothetical protein PHLCEN_2v1255 [Hermanssonia centrifuga]|uniref:Uncharacterized protein n=1 Tax=Hermanssonia centrifuga TaxID=98765 RepID=A0A2R6S3P4_9APHY|nr:hypothetical protein PHLCEN_2v1255 [Hermanssonia centrifuga]